MVVKEEIVVNVFNVIANTRHVIDLTITRFFSAVNNPEKKILC